MLKGWGWGRGIADNAGDDEGSLNGGLSVSEGLGGDCPQIGWGRRGGVDVVGAHGQCLVEVDNEAACVPLGGAFGFKADDVAMATSARFTVEKP